MAVLDLVQRFPDLHVVFPVHLNPAVRATVSAVLADVTRVHLLEPLDYVAFINLLRRADLILTDSGGVQEEAPSLGKPLLVLRTVTERPEAFLAGLARVIGTDRETIVAEVNRLLTDPAAYAAMRSATNPYGDGCAAERITTSIRRWIRGDAPSLPADEEFEGDGLRERCVA